MGKYQGTESTYQIDIRIPKEYALIFKADLSAISNATQTNLVDGDDYVLRITLNDVNSTYAAKIPYSFNLIPRIAPEYYRITPVTTLMVHRGDGFFKIGEANEIAFRVLYNSIVDFDKSILNQDESYSRTYRNPDILAYGGMSDQKGYLPTEKEKLIPIPFYFSFSTAAYNSSLNPSNGPAGPITAVGQAYGDGLANTRFAQKIVLEDTLPVYKDVNGETRTAVPAPGKNEGWSFQNGVATYTAEAIGEAAKPKEERDNSKITADMAADRQIYQGKVALWLLFPGAPTIEARNHDIINNAKATIYPLDMARDSQEYTVEPQVKNDELIFRFSKQPYYTNGLFVKHSNDAFKIPFYDTFMHQAQAGYVINISNKTQFDMTNIVLEDGIFDAETFLKNIRLTNDLATNNIQEMYLLYKDGRKVMVNEGNAFKIHQSYTLDQETITKVQEQVMAVQADNTGEALEAARNTKPNDDVGQKLVIEMKPDFVLKPGQNLSYFLNMGFSHPYGLKNTRPFGPNGLSEEIKNEANLKADIIVGSKVDKLDLKSSSGIRLYEKENRINLTKNISNSGVLSAGQNIYYRVGLQLGDLAPSTEIINPVLVDVLPKGLSLHHITQNDHTGASHHERFFRTRNYNYMDTASVENNKAVFTVINNYQGTGRQAVIMKLKENIKVEEIKSVGFLLSGSVNNNAMPIGNDNEVFFTADNWAAIRDTLSTKPEQESNTLVADKFDINDNNNWDEKVLSAKATFNANVGGKIEAIKRIKLAESKIWSSTGINTNYNQEFEYKLQVNNNKSDITQMVIYDVLPKLDDKNYIGDTPRNSEFANVLRGPIASEQNADKFEYYYATEANPTENPNQGINDLTWQTATELGEDFSGVTAIKIQLKENHTLQVNEPISFIVPMTAPAYDSAKNLSLAQANNNFAIQYNGQTSFGQSNTVYNEMPVTVKAEKKWNVPEGFETEIPHDKVKFALYRNDVEIEEINVPQNTTYRFADSDKNFTVDSEKATVVWTELPDKDNAGNKYVYTVKEIPFAKEYSAATTANGNDFVITNTLEKVDVRANKIWVNSPAGAKPEIAIQLFRRIAADGEKELVDEKTLAPGATSVTFEKVDRFNEDRVEYLYFVSEKEVPENYTMTTSGNNITNTYQPPTDPTDPPGPTNPTGPTTPISPVRPTPPTLTPIEDTQVPLGNNDIIEVPETVVPGPEEESLEDGNVPREGMETIKNVPKTGTGATQIVVTVDAILNKETEIEEEQEQEQK